MILRRFTSGPCQVCITMRSISHRVGALAVLEDGWSGCRWVIGNPNGTVTHSNTTCLCLNMTCEYMWWSKKTCLIGTILIWLVLWNIFYFPYIWANYNDLTATSLESWIIRGIIPKWPYFRLVNYCNLPRYIGNNNPIWLSHFSEE